VLRRIFGSGRDEVTGGWRKLLNEEFHNLYSSPSIIRVIEDEMGRDCSTNERKKGTHVGYWRGTMLQIGRSPVRFPMR
jgi:hypothetical protein